MAVQADFFGDNNNYNQNMGLGFPFSLPLPVMPQDWLVACSSSYMGIEENNGVCFQENSMQQTPINNPQFHQVFQFIGPNNININQEAAVPGPSSYASSSSTLLPMDFSQFLASELEKQRVEMESYLQLQNERLRLVLREETRQRGVVLQKYATKLMSLVQQKDKELALTNNRRLELQEYLIKSDFELKTWKQKAMENEALILDLTNKINQVKERLSLVSNGVPDSESICDSSTKSSMVIKNSSDNYFCKVCHVRSSCVLFLPCRHLCCCQSCEGFLGFCPVCEGVKKASIEVFLA